MFNLIGVGYACMGATARCKPQAGLLSISYTGAVSLCAMGLLVDRIGAAWPGESSCVTYFDRAEVQFDWATAASVRGSSVLGHAASAIIVRRGELASANHFCAALAQKGILRMAFTAEDETLARQWSLGAGALALSASCKRGRPAA